MFMPIYLFLLCFHASTSSVRSGRVPVKRCPHAGVGNDCLGLGGGRMGLTRLWPFLAIFFFSWPFFLRTFFFCKKKNIFIFLMFFRQEKLLAFYLAFLGLFFFAPRVAIPYTVPIPHSSFLPYPHLY